MNYDKQKSIEIEQERLNLKLKKQKERKAEENKRKIDLRRIEEKQLAGLRYKKHLRSDQRKRDQKESERTDSGRTRKVEDEARQNRERAEELYTPEEREIKGLDHKSYIEFNNMMSAGECTDIYDYKRIKRNKESESNERRKILKGL